MDERFELNGISFVWDQNKAQENLRKHRVAFEQAAETFFDPFLCVLDASSESEGRDGIVGMDEQWNLLFVVYIVIEDESVRIVSARRATREERRLYED